VGVTVNHQEWFDQQAPQWDEKLPPDVLAKLQALIAKAAIQHGDVVLDLGCGTGVLFRWLRASVGPAGEVVAIDLSGEMLRRARLKGEGVPCLLADGQHLPSSDTAFDWVVCNAILPHFPDKHQALREIRRVLRPGGQVLICHPKGRHATNAIHRSIGGTVGNDLVPDPDQVRQLLRSAEIDCSAIRDEPDGYEVWAYR